MNDSDSKLDIIFKNLSVISFDTYIDKHFLLLKEL